MNRNELCVINLGGGVGGVQLIKAKVPYTVKIVAGPEARVSEYYSKAGFTYFIHLQPDDQCGNNSWKYGI